MDLVRAITNIYPDAKPNVDYILQDDGDGAYIREWFYSQPQPTKDELVVAWDEIDNAPVLTPPTVEQQIALLKQSDKDQNTLIDMLAQTVFQ